ncbi:MAG: beta-glucosidase BglX [Bacteroidales bacterium]|nr:beta-glucosidase BglX [Bacteroidales bacterium]MDD6668626.1 beta-glucosidase BglX [Bacteroidales bacterium]
MTTNYSKHLKRLLTVVAAVGTSALSAFAQVDEAKMNKFVDDLMAKMTVAEKIGQLNLGAAGCPIVVNSPIGLEEAAAQGYISACGGANMDLQRIAVEKSRLGIPILFGFDVIHGLSTTFPIPLAMSTSWNMPLIERTAQIAAKEACAFGICWTWSPMVDIARDPRWGRIAEGAGEDPYLGSCIARAMVHGYQGDDLSSDTTLLACFKHYALYGAAEGGRDYNTVDMSRWYMHNFYLPPYKAAVEAGCATGMSSFNVVDGVPATGNSYLLDEVLRRQWGFKGFVVSDAFSIAEIAFHRASDPEGAAQLAISAGLDMDLASSHYTKYLAKLLDEKKITMEMIDRSVRRILEAKYRLGLFDDPYRYLKQKSDPARQACFLCDEHVAVARRMAGESIVLLKNDGGLLPLSDKHKRIAVVGPIGRMPEQLFGTWSALPDGRKSVSVAEALRRAVGDGCTVTYAQGCLDTEGYGDYYNVDGTEQSAEMIAEAVASAKDADVVVACVGEPSGWSGEVNSRVYIGLPPSQKALLKALKATGKPVIVLVMSGRPLVLTDEDATFPAIVEAWHGGTSAADGIADVLTGKVNPSAKLTTTFPRYKGQVPIHYNHLHTGRAIGEYENPGAVSKYIDIPLENNTPLYPFGYGLSYNTYAYSNLRVDKTSAKGENDAIVVSIDVTNQGERSGKEIVQLYVTDLIASTSRPILELKGFEKLEFNPGETKTVSFTVTTEQLKFYNSDLKYDWEPGDFELAIAPNSRDLNKVKIHWEK